MFIEVTSQPQNTRPSGYTPWGRAVRTFLGIVLVGFIAWHDIVLSGEVSWNRQAVNMVAEDEELSVFLQRLFAQINMPVQTSKRVTGRVSGAFREPAEVLFDEIADSYGLAWYYDGAKMYVYSLSEIESRLIKLQPETARRFPRLLNDLQVADSKYPLRQAAEDGYFLVAGPPRFVERVEEVADTVGRALREPVEKKAAQNLPTKQTKKPTKPSVKKPSRSKKQQRGFFMPADSRQVIRVFRLRHAWADDKVIQENGVRTILPGVASSVRAMMGRDKDAVARRQQQVLPVSGGGLLGKGLARIGREEVVDKPSVDDFFAKYRDKPKQVGFIDGSGVVRADTRLNAIVVRDFERNMPLYEELIAALDLPAPLIEIEAAIVDISSDSSEELGVDFSLLLSNREGRVSAPLVGLNPGDLANGIAPRAQALIGSEKNFLFARINALAENGDATIQSTPRVLTMDNNEAVLSSTQEFFVRVAGRDAVDLFNVNVGLTLRVTPSLLEDDGRVRFKLQVEIKDGAIEAASSVDSIPVISRSGITATLIVEEGESLFIGGLTSERTATGRSGVPGLSKIPIFGALFRTDRTETRRFQRLFLLTPKLIRGAT